MTKTPLRVALLLLACLVLSLGACTFHSEEELYGIAPCDTSLVTWDYNIQAILDKNCVPCHNEELQYNGVRHDVYELELIVVEDGRLNGVVNHLPGFVQMPYLLPQLPECERLLINTWIERGAPRN